MAIEKVLNIRVNELERSACRRYLDLNGEWNFQLDYDKVGEATGAIQDTSFYEDTIQVPGCLEAQGKGLEYQPICRPEIGGGPDHPYFGVSWYQKEFEYGSRPDGRIQMLYFGGVATNCKVWLNGTLLGAHDFGSTPFGFPVTDILNYNGKNILTIRVENRHSNERIKETAHDFGESVREIRWSGVHRSVELVSLPATYIKDVFAVPSISGSRFSCKIQLHCENKIELNKLYLRATVSSWKEGIICGESCCPASEAMHPGHPIILNVPVSNPHLWSETDPYLYRIVIYLCTEDGEVMDTWTLRSGLREISYDGEHILLNGIPIYLRGDMVHYHWPEYVCTPIDREELRRGLITYKNFGFNFLRHHTFFPNEEYLDVCDEIGLLCHNELGIACWYKNTPGMTDEIRTAIWKESILRVRNHPAVIIYCLGNERYPTDSDIELFSKLTFSLDTSRLLQSDSPGFFLFEDGTRQRAPIYHELRNSGASYVDTSLKNKYKGALRPWRMQWAMERTKEAGLDMYLPEFIRNTQLLQARSRKILLEELRMQATSYWDVYDFRETHFQGFELCTFRDSGSFIWGVVDDYFGSKIAGPEEVKQYTNDTVLLWATEWDHRIFSSQITSDPPFIMTFLCSHYGKKPIRDAHFTWRVKNSTGKVIDSGEVNHISVQCGELKTILSDYRILPSQDKAEKMILQVSLSDGETSASNEWDFWVFPKINLSTIQKPIYAQNMHPYFNKLFVNKVCPQIIVEPDSLETDGVLITEQMSEDVLGYLNAGGNVLLLGENHFKGEITGWGAGRSEFTRGSIIHEHPIFAEFPHEGWCDIPFAALMNSPKHLDGRHPGTTFVYDLSSFPQETQPIIQGIPSYKADHPKKLGFLFEIGVGKGRLMVTTFHFDYNDIYNHRMSFFSPAALYLFGEILKYLSGNQKTEVPCITCEELKGILNEKKEASSEMIPSAI